ncbi:MAG: hypothetical protein NTW11_00770 [Candidatus Staskawiczbacteria bacterium]|nr:hypothetical protein [Candidatus Staskawiczbacteria bacterium]
MANRAEKGPGQAEDWFSREPRTFETDVDQEDYLKRKIEALERELNQTRADLKVFQGDMGVLRGENVEK